MLSSHITQGFRSFGAQQITRVKCTIVLGPKVHSCLSEGDAQNGSEDALLSSSQ